MTARLVIWMMSIAGYALAARAAGDPGDLGAKQLRDGDLVFQQSRSEQSRAISLLTKSRYTHMGIVFHEGGEPFVLEAVQPVKRTPYRRWVMRGVDRHVVVKRLADASTVLTTEVVQRMKSIGESFRGKSYDTVFAWSDERLYCSELVYKLYDRGAGVRLGAPQKLGDFRLDHPAVADEVRARYGAKVPVDEPVVSPQAMFEDPRLVTVYSN